LKEAVIEWIKTSIKNRENDFKAALQKAEREIMGSFSYENKWKADTSSKASLSE
jgi:hypothetical protein